MHSAFLFAAAAAPFWMQLILPLSTASAFVIIPPHISTPAASTTAVARQRAAAGRAAVARRMSVASYSSPLNSPTMSSLCSGGLGWRGKAAGVGALLSSGRAAVVGGRASRMTVSSTAAPAVEVAGDSGGGGSGDEDGGAVTAVVVDEFDVKTNLLNQIDLASSSRKRTEVNELMLKLEPMNPTESPAKSPVLNGVWEFLYTGGLSPGTLAVQIVSRVAKTFSAVVDVKSITLTIKRDQPRVEASVKASIFGAQAQVKVRTRLERKSDMRLQEVYEEAEVAGVKIPIPSRVQPRRTLFITYLDDDIMIARDDSGAPDLLIRKEKDFRFNTGTPSASEDDLSPGSG